MSFVRKHLKLVFEDPELEGLVVRAKRLSIGRALDLVGLSELRNVAESSPELKAKLIELFDTLAEVIIDWNLEEPVDPRNPDGETKPVPVTGAALAEQDMEFIMALVGALQSATAGVSDPLAPASSSGAMSLEASMPMETLSESLESSPTPV